MNKNKIDFIIKQEVLSILKICLDKNYFQCQEKYYAGTEVLIMENLPSPLLSEIFIENFEQRLSNNL